MTLAGGETIDAELLLVAVGRGPVSAGLGYEEVGVAMDRGFVLVDEYCRTNVPTISAVGDLTPGLQLAHVGFAEGILVAERLAGPDRRADQLRRRAAGHLLRPGGRLGRHHLGHRGRARHRDHRVHLRPGRQRQEPDPETQG